MNWFAKFEKKFSKYAIKNLMFYIIVLYAIGFVMNTFFNGLYDAYFSLDFAMIFKGQVWRLVTFIVQPPSNSIIFVVFVLYFYYLIGSVLEKIWGAFRFNVYFFTGVILNILASLIIYLVFGLSFKLSTNYINLALFMAFAMEQPDMEVLLFFIIPIKIKWMAILDAVIFGITIVFGYLVPFLPRNVWYSLYAAGFLAPSAIMCYANATAALVSMLNFIIFFFLYKKGPAKSSTQRNFDKAMRTAKKAQQNARKETASPDNREQQSQAQHAKRGVPKHRCAVCGRTELDDENLTFRFCSKCAGNYEYCSDHLYTHIHVTGDKQ
ncbi:MAG: hypothetical protein Q4E78_07315 [Eubacteriales bacterium]|nr:hypothetical protein [Eubacteriales bacterium]